MKKKMRKKAETGKRRGLLLRTVSLAAVLGLGLAGCGSAAKGDSAAEAADTVEADTAFDEYAYAGQMNEKAFYDAGAEDASAIEQEGTAETAKEVETEGDQMQVQDTRRKLIRDVNLEVETESFDQFLADLQEKTQHLGGYIEQSSTYNGSGYYDGVTRNANLTIRIPAEQLDAFLSEVSVVSNVISRDESVTDVTLKYVDLESHKKALETEQTRLMELMEQAESMEDIIALESRLSQVRYEIESMESQLRTLSNQVSYSTVTLYVREVKIYTPVKEQTAGEKMVSGFRSSLLGVGQDLLDLFIGFVINLPYLVVWAAVIIAVVWIIRLFGRRRRKRHQKETEVSPRKEERKAE